MTRLITVGEARPARALAALFGAAVVAFPAVALGDSGGSQGAAATGALGPLFALTVAVERSWETAFTLFESSAVAVGRLIAWLHAPLGELKRALDEAQRAFDEAERALTGAPPSQAASDARDAAFREARGRLDEARERVTGLVRHPVYVAYKRRVILYGSFFLGPALAFAGRVTLFRAMGFAEMPATLDMILTGIIIGSGSEPVHGLVSSLGGLGRALGTLGDLARRGPASDAVTVAVKPAATGDAARDAGGG
jgi:hypothetical protein